MENIPQVSIQDGEMQVDEDVNNGEIVVPVDGINTNTSLFVERGSKKNMIKSAKEQLKRKETDMGKLCLENPLQKLT